MLYAIVETDNPLAVHGLFDTKERAERHLKTVIPIYVMKQYFLDKTLAADSFTVRVYCRTNKEFLT